MKSEQPTILRKHTGGVLVVRVQQPNPCQSDLSIPAGETHKRRSTAAKWPDQQFGNTSLARGASVLFTHLPELQILRKTLSRGFARPFNFKPHKSPKVLRPPSLHTALEGPLTNRTILLPTIHPTCNTAASHSLSQLSRCWLPLLSKSPPGHPRHPQILNVFRINADSSTATTPPNQQVLASLLPRLPASAPPRAQQAAPSPVLSG